jgi:voltage-gated potassium channel
MPPSAAMTPKIEPALKRKSRLNPWLHVGIRLAVLLALLVFIISVHWIERGAFKDSYDGKISFSDIIYFTMISATTTGYGDIVPVTDRARLFDALVVTPIRIFFILILAGTAYTFVIKRTWNRWLMKIIQKNLRNHIVIAGYGVSNSKTLEELLARGVDPRRIVVIDPRQEAVDKAMECGVAVLLGDASRDEILLAAHIERACALLVSAGRDDSAILIVLTARKRAPDLKISVTIRMAENEDIAHQAGADTVVNPVSFAGLLLASSLDGPNRADYLNDLATSEGRVMLREREVEQHEVGKSADEICTGQAVRLIRDNKPHGPHDAAFGRLIPGDRVLEIIDSTA